MNPELKFFLQQGPTSVKELARLTGKSTSTLYKDLKAVPFMIVEGGKYSLPPEQIVDAPLANETVPPQPTPATGKVGRKATAAGQTLKAGSSDNPRRAGSHGYRSLQIIIDNPGITTEDYLAKGGRLNDLRWDLAHGNVVTS
jgi:hypothetical protein